jgi:hypothetical protein
MCASPLKLQDFDPAGQNPDVPSRSPRSRHDCCVSPLPRRARNGLMHRSQRRGEVGRAGNILGRLGMDLLTHLTKEPLPFAALLGIEIVSAVSDKIIAEMMVREELCTRPRGEDKVERLVGFETGNGQHHLRDPTPSVGAAPILCRRRDRRHHPDPGQRTLAHRVDRRWPQSKEEHRNETHAPGLLLAERQSDRQTGCPLLHVP